MMELVELAETAGLLALLEEAAAEWRTAIAGGKCTDALFGAGAGGCLTGANEGEGAAAERRTNGKSGGARNVLGWNSGSGRRGGGGGNTGVRPEALLMESLEELADDEGASEMGDDKPPGALAGKDSTGLAAGTAGGAWGAWRPELALVDMEAELMDSTSLLFLLLR